MSVAAVWPHGRVAEDFGEPVKVDVPVLLLSGTHDPSTTPEWGEEAASHLPNGLHVVVPGGHGVFGPEVRRLEREFLEREFLEREFLEREFLEQGSVKKLDLIEVKRLKRPALVLP